MNAPEAPDGYALYFHTYPWGRWGGESRKAYLFGRTSNEAKVHGAWLAKDGSAMKTYCGRDSWLHDNWTEELDPWIEDLCFDGCAERAVFQLSYVQIELGQLSGPLDL